MEAPVLEEVGEVEKETTSTTNEFIFSTGHEPINSLNYVNIKINSEDISSVRVFGSTNKNISIFDNNGKVNKHLVHPKDIYLKVEITNTSGLTITSTYKLGTSEIVL